MPGGLLAPVLQGVQAEVGELRDLLARRPDTEDAAGVLGSGVVGVEVVRQPSVTARHGVEGTGPAGPARPGRTPAQWMLSTSSATTVSSPWPVFTTVSPGSVSSRSWMEARIVGLSLKDRPVAPGPPQNRVSPVKTVLQLRGVEAGAARRVARACASPPAGCRRRRTWRPRPGRGRAPRRGARRPTACGRPGEPDRRAGGLAQRDRGGDVVVVPVGEHDRAPRCGQRPPPGSGRRRAGRR